MNTNQDLNPNVPTVIFIRSLGHSGSTIASYILCQEFNVVALGEVWNFLHRLKAKDDTVDYPCSCGKTSNSDCAFWHTVSQTISDCPTLKDQYHKTLRIAHDTFGVPVVDIGKTAAAYDLASKLADEGKINLYTVFLIRDVRGWATSVSEKSGRKSFFALLKLMRRWLKENKQIVNEHETQKSTSVLVSYESLCFLGTTYFVNQIEQNVPLRLSSQTNSPHHVVFGNIKSLHGFTGIQYDTRWFGDRKISFLYSVSSNIHAFNNRTALYSLHTKFTQARKAVNKFKSER